MKMFFLLSIPLFTSAMAQEYNLPIEEWTLKNGLKVLVLEDHSMPLITLQVWARAGSRNEYPGITGISHLLEHMMFKGTEKIGSQEFSKIIQRFGGIDNAFTSSDMTAYFEEVPSGRLEKLLELEADRLQNLVFREFSEERNVVMEERRLRTENSPQGLFWENLGLISYIAHPYRYPTVGWMSDLASIILEDVKRYYRTYYAPNNVFLVLVGDVKKNEAFSLVKKYFSSISPLEKIPEVRTEEPPQRGERRATIEVEGAVKKMGITFHIPSAKNPDYFALVQLAQILGGSKTSRLYKSLVYEKQLVGNISAWADRSLDPGLFYIIADVHLSSSLSEVEKEILKEIDIIKEDGPTPKELDRALIRAKSEFIMRQQSVLGQGFLIGSFEISTGYEKVNSYIQELEKVKPDDVRRVAKTYLKENARNTLIMIPKPSKEEEK